MTDPADQDARDLVASCKGMSDEQIIAEHHADYFDKAKPYVRIAFEQMGIAEHEVTAWIYRNVK